MKIEVRFLYTMIMIIFSLGGGFKYFYVHPYLGIPILTNLIFFRWVETTNQ